MSAEQEQEEPTFLLRFPFGLPERFLDQIEYKGPDSLVGLYWECGGDELAVYDSRTESAGMHNHWPYLELMRRPLVWHWLDENYIDLGSSEEPGTHHMIVSKERNEGYIAEEREARRIITRQQFEPGDFS